MENHSFLLGDEFKIATQVEDHAKSEISIPKLRDKMLANINQLYTGQKNSICIF